jgi:uncharacterized protein YkwD
MKKIVMLLALLAVTLLVVSSCASSGISQEEYDSVCNELSTVQSQVASLQSKLAEAEKPDPQIELLNERYDTLKSEYDELQDKYEKLGSENVELKDEYDALMMQYTILEASYEDLEKQYQAALEETPEIVNEGDLELALFELINTERAAHGLDEMVVGEYLYKSAISHSKNMATSGRLEEPNKGSYQEVIWATGYTDTQVMAESIFTLWKNTARYEIEFLTDVTTYGAVAVYKSGDIYYITYLCDIYR